MRRICVVGSSNMDLVTRIARLPEAGETLAADGFATGPGGKGANQAVAAALNGAEVVFVTRVGDDGFGRDLLARYRALGLAVVPDATVAATPTGTATILVERSGENRILVAAGANGELTAAAVDAAADLLRASALVVLQLEIPLDAVFRAVAICREAGIDVLLNPAPAKADLDLARIASTRFLVPNRGELALLTGRPTGSRDEVRAAAGALIAGGIGTVIVTLGDEGALVVEADDARHVPAPRVAPVDTTGAGDAFVGAFAERWVATGDLDAAVAAAVRYAADSTTLAGAQTSYVDARRGRPEQPDGEIR